MITGVGMCLHHPHPTLWLAVCFPSVGSAYWISSQGSMGFVCRSLWSVPPQSPLFLWLYLEPLLRRSAGLLLLCTQSSVAHWLMPSTCADVWFCRSAPWSPAASALEKLGPDRIALVGISRPMKKWDPFFPPAFWKTSSLFKGACQLG